MTNRGEKILVVDDESIIRELFEEAFSLSGYSVVSAATAEEALDILDRETINVMFLDLKLPGMSGIDLCKAIKRDQPTSRIYAVTAYAPLLDLPDCRAAGFGDYFTKPVNLRALFKVAETAFRDLRGTD